MRRLNALFTSVRPYLPGVLLVVLIFSMFFIWYGVLAEERGGKLTVAFLDVGQGDAIYIESPTGIQILVDGGPDKSVLAELGRMMPFFDRSIDALIVTNPDQDHFAGFIDVLERYRVETFIEPGVLKESASYGDLLRHVKDEGAARAIARRGQSIDLGGGAVIEILFPDRDVSGLEPNTGSIIARLRYGATSVLLMGDSVNAIEQYLVSLDGANLKSDILKVGHHGSRTSTSDALLGLASPAYAVISAGKDNRYGHPHREVLDALARFEIETLITKDDGRIMFRSDGSQFTRIQ